MRSLIGWLLPSGLEHQGCSTRISRIVVAIVSVVVCSIHSVAMSVQPLNDLWEAAAGQPYEPTIGKESQFTVGITLLFTGIHHLSLFVVQEVNSDIYSSYPVRLLRSEYAASFQAQALCLD